MNEDIVIQSLDISFRDKQRIVPVVRDVNVTFHAGTVTGLIGESGSGKSVLGMSILRLLPASAKVEGTCLYGGRDLYRLTEKEMCKVRGQQIGLIPQNPTESLNPVRTVGRQLTECVTIHRPGEKKAAEERRNTLLARFGFAQPDKINRAYSFQLSGGMNQRVVSAMGLMSKPEWIIADEPTKGLDAILRKQVYSVLREISETETKGMILITHDISLAGAICDRLLVLYKGMLLEQGNTRDILSSPLHPYTKGLLASLPERGMHPIRRANQQSDCIGCGFCPRCEYATERCRREIPPETVVDGGRIVRCFLYA